MLFKCPIFSACARIDYYVKPTADCTLKIDSEKRPLNKHNKPPGIKSKNCSIFTCLVAPRISHDRRIQFTYYPVSERGK